MKKLLTGFILLFCFLCTDAQTNQNAENHLPFEKTYLHTDRDVYAPGDTLWFKAYLVNGQTNIPISSSGNLYVEFISTDSARILKRETIHIADGTGNGDFDLADSIAPGKYKLRAYTNWMRNFGDNFIFEKNITLLGTPTVATENKLEKKAAKATENNKKSVATAMPSPVNQPTIRFYPEGGSMVEGISSLIAVKAEDGYGTGIPASGVIISAHGDTLTRFNCDSLGFGIFTLLPIKGQTYNALAYFKSSKTFSLPRALSKGPVIHTKQSDSLLQITITCNDTPARPSYTLLIKHTGAILVKKQFQMSGHQSLLNISTAGFSEGILAITLLDEGNKPVCERLVYIGTSLKSGTLVLSTDKKIYQPRQPVNVQINAPANSNLSMAVVDAAIVPRQTDDILSYLKLQSDIKGNIEHASRYFDTTNINRFKQLDLLLMTQGWRDFIWRRLADTAIRISYAPENSLTVSGKVRDENTNKYLPGSNISLYAPGAKDTKLFSTQTDSLGRFNISGLMLYGVQNIRLASVNFKGKKLGSFMVDTVLPLPLNKPNLKKAIETPADSTTALAIAKREDIIKNTRFEGATQLKEVKVAAKQNIIMRDGLPHTIWGPDQVFNIKPQDEEYKTLEWYILQNAEGAHESMPPNPPNPTGVYFMGVIAKFRSMPSLQGGYTEVPSFGYDKIYPKFFINGVQLAFEDETQAEAYRRIYFNAPIQKFKKIVIRRVVSLGADDFLIYLTLPENGLVDNPGMINMNIPGYYQARTFYAPAPNAKPSVNDYRTTIYWDPNIKTDAAGKANISFYNAVLQTNVRIIVQGIAPNGDPVTAVGSYEIKE